MTRFSLAMDSGRNGDGENYGERESLEDESDNESEQPEKVVVVETQDNQDEDCKIPAE